MSKEKSLVSKVVVKKMLSIILPVYNEYQFTSWCLLSIENRMSVPYELIIVNDGSDEKTSSMLKDYQNRHSENTKYIETPSQSFHSLSCNIGIDNSIGEYICLLNPITRNGLPDV